MTPQPFLSIVVPVFNDAATIAGALESCLMQTLTEIEVVCVDDASTDASADIIEQFRARDARVRLVRLPTNRSAFQARRAGVLAANGAHVLFLDGDDELAPEAARVALSRAQSADADLVGFGVTVVGADGRTGGRYEQSLQPGHPSLDGTAVLRELFPLGEPAQGQLWRYLFRTALVRDAYALLPEDLVLTRVNDLPLMFLIAALSERYVSTPERLYRYHLGRGGSGHRVDSVERAQFYVAAIASIDSIAPAVRKLAQERADAALLLESYESVRSWIIAYVSHQLADASDSAMLDVALEHLFAQASLPDIVHASLQHFPDTLSTLRHHTPWEDISAEPKRSVLLAISRLGTGGVAAVLLAQARYLVDAGLRVTIVARKGGSDPALVPPGADFVELTRDGLFAQWREWSVLCRERDVDVVIDHQVLYTPHWPEFALVARAEGVPTIGWVHNFVGRPLYDGTDRLEIIERCAATLARVVVLSSLDVAYLKLRGITHALFLPNPPSETLIDAAQASHHRPAPTGRIELLWWGRLEERTKKISELLDVAEHLRELEADFRLTIIGPGDEGWTPEQVNAEAGRRGLKDRVNAIGALHGSELRAAIDAADAVVSTSIIEGHPLVLDEAQSRGLPIFLYELPWLTIAQDNAGIASVPQGDSRALARRIHEIVRPGDRYEHMAAAAIEAARRVHSPDFGLLYRDLIVGSVPAGTSPEPTLDDARLLLNLMLFYAARAPSQDAAPRPAAPGIVNRLGTWAKHAARAGLRRVPFLRRVVRRTKRWISKS